MSESQSQKSQHAYVQCRTWADTFAGSEAHVFEHAQEADSIIVSVGGDLARILGVKQIAEKFADSQWLRADEVQRAFAQAVNSNSNPMEHPRKLYASGLFIGDVFSPYTCRVGVGWGEAADVQQIADALQRVLEEQNYGVTSTRKRPAPRRVVVLDEAHSLYMPTTKHQGSSYNISILALCADMITDDVVASLQRDLNAGVGRV